MRVSSIIGWLAVVAGLSMLACSGGGGQPEATAVETRVATVSPTAELASPTVGASTTTATPATGEANTTEGVMALARLVDDALGRGDIGAVTSRLRGGPAVEFSQWGQPVTTLPLERASAELSQLLTRTRATDRDSYGMAGPKVWRVGYDLTRPHLVVTNISLDEATGYRRLALLLRLRHCDADCAAADAGRWVVTGVVLQWGGEAFLRPGEEYFNTFGRLGEAYRRPLVLTPEIRGAAAAVAEAMGNGVRSIPDCGPDAGCITTDDPGVAVDLGIMRLSFNAPAGEGGSARVYAGRMADGGWQYWFGTQQLGYQMVDLPGDVLVCANGDGLNVRAEPDANSTAVAFLGDLTKVRAEEFRLTTAGSFAPGGTAGSGWYRISGRNAAGGGWVSAKFVSDARLGDCKVHDAIERP